MGFEILETGALVRRIFCADGRDATPSNESFLEIPVLSDVKTRSMKFQLFEIASVLADDVRKTGLTHRPVDEGKGSQARKLPAICKIVLVHRCSILALHLRHEGDTSPATFASQSKNTEVGQSS